MNIATKTNETNAKKNISKKLDVVVMENNYNVFIHFQVFDILFFTYSLDQAKNVINTKKPQH